MINLEENVAITVRQARTLLGNAHSICVLYDGEEYDVTAGNNIIMDTFGDFVISGISSIKEREYNIFLKQEYVKATK